MTIRRPSRENLKDISERHHLHLTEAELETYYDVVCGVMDSYDVLDQIPDPVRPLYDAHRQVGARPEPEDDPLNGIVRLCSVKAVNAGGSALAGGMPYYKYVANRILTATQNFLGGAKLSEYHTGYRAFSRAVLEACALEENSDDFVFDNQMLAQIHLAGFEIGEVSCPAAYFEEASSIDFRRSVRYGLGVLEVSLRGFLHRTGIAPQRIFDVNGRRLELPNGPA